MQKVGIWPLVAALASAGLCAPTAARAQNTNDVPKDYPACDTAPDETSMQAAQGAFQAGNASFNEADYPRAIFYWEDAYRRDCTAHAMLKNLARAYELNEQYRLAIHALKTYLARKPDSGEDEAIGRRIDNLEQKLAERDAAAVVVPPKPQTKPEPKPQAKPKPAAPPVDDGFTSDEPVTEEDEAEGRPVLPLIVAGIGGVVGVVGLVEWGVARQDELDAEEDCGDAGRDMCNADARAAGNAALDRQVIWGVVGGGGAAIAVGGLIWYFVQDDPSDTESDFTRVTPNLGVGYAGLSFEGTF